MIYFIKMYQIKLTKLFKAEYFGREIPHYFYRIFQKLKIWINNI